MRQETVSRKLVWLFVIWDLEFGICDLEFRFCDLELGFWDFSHLAVLGELGCLFFQD